MVPGVDGVSADICEVMGVDRQGIDTESGTTARFRIGTQSCTTIQMQE